jgi:UDP-glucose 4-epimerase
MDKIVITGGNGFLGSYIAQEFFHHGCDVFSIDVRKGNNLFGTNLIMDLSSPEFGNFLENKQPDLLIHAAGTASVFNSIQDPLTDFKRNVMITAEVLDMVKNQTPSCKVIFLSSAAVYGNPSTLPILETDALNPISPYGYDKLFCEKLIEEYTKIFELRASIVRIFSAYGPGLHKQIVWDVCRKIVSAPEVSLSGNGTETRDFIHSTDVAKALFLVANKSPFNGDVYNLASGTQTSIMSLADGLLRIFSSPKQLVFSGENRPGDPLFWQANIQKISNLGFSPTMDVMSGLEEYANWFLNEK